MKQELIGLANPQADANKLHRIIAYLTQENRAAQAKAASGMLDGGASCRRVNATAAAVLILCGDSDWQ